uniref:CSON002842 protein n=1 Tax=Culicoides sonorensis TaxID=179676 RepID=A0A336MLP8_CULSO
MSLSKETSTVTIDHIPVEIISKIFSYLKTRHRKVASLVCSKWRNATRCPSFYRTLRLHKGLYLDEPPLSLFQNSYHPFSVIIFDDIDEFTQDISEFWKVVAESVRELHFRSCEGLDQFELCTLLSHLKNVNKIKITGTNSINNAKMEKSFENIKILDISDTEMPAWYIEALVGSFPKLQELNLGSYTYDGWDAPEDYVQNISTTAKSSAFGDWVKNLSKLAPKVTLFYDYQIVLRTEMILKEFLEIPNLEVRSLNIKVEGVQVNALQNFIEIKGKHLQKLEIPDAQLLNEKHLELINNNCIKLKELKFCFNESSNVPVIEKLSNLCNLTELVFAGPEPEPESEPFEFNFTGKVLQFKEMRSLIISNVKLDSNLVSFKNLLESCTFLTELSLNDCFINSEGLKIVYSSCKALESLHLNCNEQITDNCLFFSNDNLSINDLKYLESLNLNNCCNITNQSLKKLKFSEIFKLGLREITQISVEGITELCKNCPSITHLDLNGCASIDDDCVEIITKNLHQLQDIDLCGTKTTSKCFEFITENCMEIKNVNISYQPPKDSKAAEILLQKRILHFLSALAMNNICERLVIPDLGEI